MNCDLSQAQYFEVTSGSCASKGYADITSSHGCANAAQALALANTTVADDGQNGVSYDPPFCYYESSALKYNSNGQNTGPCTTGDKCLCQQAAILGSGSGLFLGEGVGLGFSLF